MRWPRGGAKGPAAPGAAPAGGTAATPGDAPLAELRDVSLAYADETGAPLPALDGVSLAVRRGEAVALVGPNGCGKSTALRTLCGLALPDSGEVRFDGERVDAPAMADAAFAKRLHQRMGLVFQDADAQLFCPTVLDEVAFGPRQMGLAEEEVAARCEDAMRLFDVAHLAGRAPYRLSGGEKRRVALACVVSMGPELLVLDEPTDGLDQASRDAVVGFLCAFVSAGGAVLVTTHHPDLVADLGAREVHMGPDHRVLG